MTELFEVFRFIFIVVKDPTAALLALAIILVIVESYFLFRSIKRYRDEVQDRIDECEDAHLERDTIQIGLIQLVAELLTTLKTSDDTDVREYQRRADYLVDQISDLNDSMLDRREEARRKRRK